MVMWEPTDTEFSVSRNFSSATHLAVEQLFPATLGLGWLAETENGNKAKQK